MSDDRHIIVDHDDVRLLAADDVGQHAVAEALLQRLLERGGIDDVHAGGVGAEIRREVVEFLEAEVGHVEPGLLHQLPEDSVGDLGIAGELMRMRGD